MENSDVIFMPFGKVLIKREENRNIYYKLMDDKTIKELSPQELKYVIDCFSHKEGYIYYSELLEKIVRNNSNCDEYYDYLMPFLNYLEVNIPDGSKQNFYDNLRTLKLNLPFKENLNKYTDTSNIESSQQTGGYDTRENILTILPETLIKYSEISKFASDPTAFFNNGVNLTFLHELSHMASSKYDEEKAIVKCGFDTYPTEDLEESNRGLTEGMTEIIAMSGVPGTIEISSGYYIECLFVNQLIQVVGKDIMLESYFSNFGIKKIKEKLISLGYNSETAKVLFRRIEENYYLRKQNNEQTVLANIQNQLIDCFSLKIEESISDPNISIEEIEQSIFIFENMLVTPEKLSIMKKNPDQYIGLSDSIDKFNRFKENITSRMKETIK